MRYVTRALTPVLEKAAAAFPAVVLTGPRRAGKTTLLGHLFPRADHLLLENPDILAQVKSDPRSFLDGLRPPVILDEIQNAPELFGYLRARMDEQPRRRGQFLLTGSQEAPLMRGVTESLAGRAAVLSLLPLARAESPKVDLLTGGYPEAVARPGARGLWYGSYLQTYLERDVRAVTNVRDLATFRRFLSLVAARHGQVLNRSDLAAPLGVSVPTVSEWLNVLEITAQILLVPPFFENLGKRLIKSPKLYWLDSGMACHLLGIRAAAELERSPFLGAVWEGFVAAEIAKRQANQGLRRELYYFRDQQGLEVDFLAQGSGGQWWLLEAKAGRTVTPADARSLGLLRNSFTARAQAAVVYRPPARGGRTRALAPGTAALSLTELMARF